MDLVYPYKRRTDESELRYSVRSACANLSFDRLVIVGDRPWTLTGFTHIKHAGPSNRYDNSCSKLLEAARSDEVSDRFILMNDDFFILKAMREVPYLFSKTMRQWLDDYQHSQGNSYFKLAQRTHAIVGDEGKFYSLHCPMILEKRRLLELAGRYQLPRGVMLRTLYGNACNVGGSQAQDRKATSGAEVLKFAAGDWFSTSNNAARTKEFQETMGRLFPKPSRFERN